MDLDKEMKKLNYALGSYPCGYEADYEINNMEDSTVFTLYDSGEMSLYVHKASNPVSQNDLDGFKKKAIKLCSHAS